MSRLDNDTKNEELVKLLERVVNQLQPMSNRQQRRAMAKRMKLQGRAKFPTSEPTLVAYTRKFEWEGEAKKLERVNIIRDVGLPSLLESVVSTMDKTDTFPVPVIHMRNQLDPEDDRGFRPPIGTNILQAAQACGWTVFSEKHLYPTQLLLLLQQSLPTAVSARAYASGLGAATIGGGLWKDIPMIICDILSEDKDGNVILAGADGHGIIDPNHPIFKMLGTVCVIQVRIWNPEKGYIFKGILIPDDRAKTPDGEPTIHVDPIQCKGRRKALAKTFHGANSGAFNPEGVLVNPSLLQCYSTGDGYHTGIIQKWAKPGTIKWSFEILQMIKDTERTREIISEFVQEAVDDFWKKGGLNGIFKRLCADDPKMEMVGKLCEAMGYDPLRIKFVWNRVQDELQRFLYHLQQGAGKYSRRYVLRMDNGVPEGHIVVGAYPGERVKYRHGQELAVTRMPSVLPQGHLVLKVIDPFYTDENGEQPWIHLNHLAIKTENGLELVHGVATIGETNTGDVFGDSDGDTLMVDDDPRSVELFKARIDFMGGPNSKFLLEPEKDSGGAKSQVPLIGPDGKPTKEGLLILGLDGRGPVGALTMFQAAFLAVGDLMGALAMAAMIQRAIDLQKHDAYLWDPEKLVSPENWEHVGGNVWKPKIHCRASRYWYDPTGAGDKCDIGKIAKWFYKRTGSKIADCNTWREDNSKKIRESDWCIRPAAGENLVHFSSRCAFTEWALKKAEHFTSDDSDVELMPLLLKALGISASPHAYILAADSVEYRDLLTKSGLVEYGNVLDQAREDKAKTEMRNARVAAQTSILGNQLRNLTMDEHLTIWCTELNSIKDNPDYESSKINRAIRAVCFEGSPVLDSLGMDVTFPCEYMQNGKLDEIYESLQGNVKHGNARDIFHAAALYLESDNLHELHEGTAVHECKECREMLEARVVSVSRKEKLGPAVAVVGKLARAINNALGHGKYRKTKKK
jgi:hypothetical protein